MSAATRAINASAFAALVLVAAWLFWPSALGGGTTYVTTHGTSMEPRFHTGDLGVLRSAGSYAAGDVVAYRSQSLDTVVMHRIVAQHGDRFVIQGDNNDWLDEDEPTQDEILGRLFLRVPQGGRALAALASPGGLAVAGSAAVALLWASRRPRSRHRARRFRPPSPHRSAAFSLPTRARARQVAVATGGVGLLAGVCCGVLLLLPSTRSDTRTLEVTQQGRFAYTGEAVRGTTYPTGVIATGDTVWMMLTRSLTVTFENTVSGPGLVDLRGAMRLDVTVAAPDGWSAVVASGPEVVMANGTATASVAVDPDAAAALLSRHYAEIGAPGGNATLTVVPVSQTVGTVQGHRFTAGSPTGLVFTLDAMSLHPAGPAGDVLTPTAQVPVQVEEVTPRRLAVLGLSVPMDVARVASAGVLAAALLAFGVGAWIGRAARGDVADQFILRHADRILPVASFAPGPAVVDVSDPEALRRVAERFDTVVLHHAGPDGDVFAVRDLEMTYRYVVPGVPQRQRGKPPVPAPAAVRAQLPVVDRADITAPMPVIAPAPRPTSASVSGALWARVA